MGDRLTLDVEEKKKGVFGVVLTRAVGRRFRGFEVDFGGNVREALESFEREARGLGLDPSLRRRIEEFLLRLWAVKHGLDPASVSLDQVLGLDWKTFFDTLVSLPENEKVFDHSFWSKYRGMVLGKE